MGTKITATATDGSNNTSEFSGVATVHDNTPEFSAVKTMQLESDPYNSTTNPKAIPGGVVRYSVTVTNTDAATTDSNTFVFMNPVPSGTELYVGDLAAPGEGPVAFTDGSPASELVYTFTSLASSTDSLSFSNDNGSTWTYVPTVDADGYDSNVTDIRVSPTGAFARADCGNVPGFSLQFRVRVK